MMRCMTPSGLQPIQEMNRYVRSKKPFVRATLTIYTMKFSGDFNDIMDREGTIDWVLLQQRPPDMLSIDPTLKKKLVVIINVS